MPARRPLRTKAAALFTAMTLLLGAAPVLEGSLDGACRLAEKLARLDPRGIQLALAKITGNFKRGNER